MRCGFTRSMAARTSSAWPGSTKMARRTAKGSSVLKGLDAGDRVVVYSEKALGARTRTHVVERIAGVSP